MLWLCLLKRLERARFVWPTVADRMVAITPALLGYLLEGIKLALNLTGDGNGSI